MLDDIEPSESKYLRWNKLCIKLYLHGLSTTNTTSERIVRNLCSPFICIQGSL